MKIYNLAFLLLFQYPFASLIADSQRTLNNQKSAAVNIVFKSTDDGQTWQDISKGLPENLQEDGMLRDGFFANENGLFLRAGNGIYHSTPNSTATFWKKEIFPDKQGSIAAGKAGIFAYNYAGQFLQKINGTSVWSPKLTSMAQDHNKFSGEWKLNESKSDSVRQFPLCIFGGGDRMRSRTMKIAGHAGFLTVDVASESADGSLVTRQEKLTFDGKETEGTFVGRPREKSGAR